MSDILSIVTQKPSIQQLKLSSMCIFVLLNMEQERCFARPSSPARFGHNPDKGLGNSSVHTSSIITTRARVSISMTCYSINLLTFDLSTCIEPTMVASLAEMKQRVYMKMCEFKCVLQASFFFPFIENYQELVPLATEKVANDKYLLIYFLVGSF